MIQVRISEEGVTLTLPPSFEAKITPDRIVIWNPLGTEIIDLDPISAGEYMFDDEGEQVSFLPA